MSVESTPRTRRTPRTSLCVFAVVVFVAFLVSDQRRGEAQAQDEATRLLGDYVRIDTSNPPGNTQKAADFLAGVLQREGINVTRYESAPGKSVLYARLNATLSPPAAKAIVLLHHIDVVPAYAPRCST